jgi:2-polyprenyl-3-methyl-5-hydroxy-6-metoxy-1,4-benzoquinol methylase
VRLDHNPNSEVFYQSEEYREAYNNTAAPQDYIDIHDMEQPPRIAHIGIENFRNKNVLDMGCGGGAFLDQIKGIADSTCGIEPFSGYHDSLVSRGHIVYAGSSEAMKDGCKLVDTIVSFGVIEHVDDPFSFLCDAFALLAPGGSMFLETDNLNDILLLLGIQGFEPFFYRTAHLWYFEEKTLKKLAEKAGFRDIKLSFRHNFDLSNALLWAKDGKPTGNNKLDILDPRINNAWREFVINAGFGDLVCLQMTK